MNGFYALLVLIAFDGASVSYIFGWGLPVAVAISVGLLLCLFAADSLDRRLEP